VIRKKMFFRGAGALALLVGVGACSSSSKSSSSSPTTAAAGSTGSTSGSSSGSSSGSQPTSGSTPAQATGAPIKVAIVCSCSGPFGGAEVPDEDVYKAWVNTVNASGGINGHSVQLTTKDDTGNPGTAATEIQSLLSSHVDAIVDMSIVDQVWAPTVQAANVPVVGGSDVDEPFGINPDFYPEGETPASENPAYLATLKQAGVKNFGVMYCVEAPTCAQSVAALKTLGAKDGIPLTYSAGIAITAPNYTAQCVAAQQKHIGALIIEDGATEIQRVAKDCDRQGFDPTYVGGGSSWALALATTPGLERDTWDWYNNLPYWVNTPSTQEMKAAVEKYYPGLQKDPLLWSNLAAASWPSGILLEDAVKAGGLGPSDTPTAAEIVKGLTSLKGDTLQGWYSPLTFTAGQPHPENCWFSARVQNSTPAIENNGQVSCQTGPSS
jgi:branched-chain amino acid transport system substrate-binding protein